MSEIDWYCSQTLAHSRNAAIAWNSVNYRVGGVAMQLHFERLHYLHLFDRALLHVKEECADGQDWSLFITDSLRELQPLPSIHDLDALHRGAFQYKSSDRYCLQYFVDSDSVLVLDYCTKSGVWLLSAGGVFPGSDEVLPLKQIVRAIFRPLGGLILHGAVVGRNEKGALLVGKSGRGKSTTALACLAAGMSYVGDDHILYYESHAYSITQLAKLSDKSASIVSGLTGRARGIGRDSSDKAILSLFPGFESQLVQALQIKVMLLPFVSNDSRPSLQSCSSAEALKALAPSSFGQIFHYHGEEMGLMAQLVKGVPTYRIGVTEDIASTVALIDAVL